MTISHWKIANAEATGKGHLKNNLPCQDYTLVRQQNGVTILLLADGAGSAAYSQLGAKAVVHKMADLLQEYIEYYYVHENELVIKKQIIEELLNAIDAIDGFEGERKDYASTLLFVAVKDEKYLAGHLGDGLIGMESKRDLEILSLPENGQFANTTYFVTTENSWEHLRLYKGTTDDLTGFALMSDGSADSLFNKREKRLAPAIKKMLEWLREYPNQKINEVLKANLESVIKEQTFDDCSLTLASLVKKEPEDFLESSNDYLHDFAGIHSVFPLKSN